MRPDADVAELRTLRAGRLLDREQLGLVAKLGLRARMNHYLQKNSREESLLEMADLKQPAWPDLKGLESLASTQLVLSAKIAVELEHNSKFVEFVQPSDFAN